MFHFDYTQVPFVCKLHHPVTQESGNHDLCAPGAKAHHAHNSSLACAYEGNIHWTQFPVFTHFFTWVISAAYFLLKFFDNKDEVSTSSNCKWKKKFKKNGKSVFSWSNQESRKYSRKCTWTGLFTVLNNCSNIVVLLSVVYVIEVQEGQCVCYISLSWVVHCFKIVPL